MEKVILGRGDFTVEIWSRGAAVNDLRLPDRTGKVESVILGYAREEDRMRGTGYLGEICGPFANRIARGGFSINGQTYTPDLNSNGTATLHGGSHSFSFQDWRVSHATADSVRLELDWSDPAGGFPGPVHAEVTYQLDGWELTHSVQASSALPGVFNIVSHPYFNLSGSAEKIDDHELMVQASSFLPTGEDLIPLPDAPWSVDSLPFDFRQPQALGQALMGNDPQIVDHGGIDHAFILDQSGMSLAARLSHRASGRQLDILTDYPALQVYTAQSLDDSAIAHPHGAGRPRCGVALETEEYPDAPRRPDFPSTLVRPGDTYRRTTTWQFRIG